MDNNCVIVVLTMAAMQCCAIKGYINFECLDFPDVTLNSDLWPGVVATVATNQDAC